MKGLVIGTFFVIKGVFQLLGVVIMYFSFAYHECTMHSFLSCGFVYHLINAIIVHSGILVLLGNTNIERER